MNTLRKSRTYEKNRSIARIIKSTANTCYYCGKELSEQEKTVDHLTPLSKGGDYSFSNLRVCCRTCNNEKGDMTESEYLDYLNEKNLINANRKKQLEQVKKQLKFRPLETPILVNIEDINIPDRFKQNPVSDHKIDRVLYYYNTYLQFDKPVTLLSSDNNLLTDGYSRFVVAEMLDIGWIPVIYER